MLLVVLKMRIFKTKKLAEELQKSVMRKFKKRKVYSPFMGNIWGADPADIQLLKNLINEFVFSYVLLIFSVNMHGLLL